jgi:hypothetical protein
MKKLSSLGNLTLVLGLLILGISCQKQQDATVTAPTDAAVIKNIAGGGNYSGKISGSDASEMSSTYTNTAGPKATQYVTFKISDLKAYLAALEAAGKTDYVNVNLAVYDSKTTTDPSLVGRTTIFFGPGAPKARTRDNGGRTGYGMVTFDPNADYMNHGGIWP